MRSLEELIDLDGKVVVVTGAGSGIGRGIAVGLAGLGAVVYGGDVDADGLRGTEAAAEEDGVAVHGVECDVAEEDSVEALFEAVAAGHGPPDVAFANAGISGPMGPVEELSTAQWHRVLAVNLDGAFFVARAAYRRMLPRRRGKIVLTSSTWGLRAAPDPGFTPYAASKGAITNLTRQLAIDMATNGVTVNAIAPGAFHTNIGDGFYDQQPDAVEALRQRTPRGRIATPEEAVGPAAFLASSASDHVNGHVLAVDGGYLAW
ncbi:MAG: SDR family oxidoreductase [Actinobacteria bacterium]|nr:SDR family oxidoreductase [Actinomycetota bacterium]